MFTKNKIFLASCVLALLILIADTRLPLGIAGGMPYTLIVLLGWWFRSERQILFVATLCVLLTAAGFFLSPDGGAFWIVVANRALAAFDIGVAATLLIIARRSIRARTANDKRLAQVLDNSSSGVVTFDEDGIIRSFNRAAAEIFRYPEHDVVGRNITILISEPFFFDDITSTTGVLPVGGTKTLETALEVEGRRKGGSAVPLDLGISEMATERGLLFTATVIDISERKRWETKLVESKDRADKANQAKSEFLSSMSHELRTPLNAILGYTQLLKSDRREPLSADQVRATENILQAGDHLLKLIDDVLNLAQIESGGAFVQIAPLDPTPSIAKCTVIAGGLATQAGLAFYDRTSQWNLPEICVDETRLEQILLNLLSNAIKYNRDKGTVTLSVEEKEQGFLRISVTDSGVGIAEERRGEIFRPFARLGKESSEITGSGIGLTITKELVDAMDGRIGFESTFNLGTTFWVEFPVLSGKLTAKTDAELIGAERVISAVTAGHKVLCIEDSPSSLGLLESIISRIPETAMIPAQTGELGMDLAEIHRPDVILMDINLPGISGIETAQRLRASEVTKNIPIIALTARAGTMGKRECAKLGFDLYLIKPIDVEEVTNAIKGFLRSNPHTAAVG